jgi:hypothetical protein
VDLYAIIKLLPFEKKLLRFPYAVREEGEAKSIFLKVKIKIKIKLKFKEKFKLNLNIISDIKFYSF